MEVKKHRRLTLKERVQIETLLNEKEIKKNGISKNSSICFNIYCGFSNIFRLGTI